VKDETTAWERAGFGLWRRERGAMLRVASSRGVVWGEVSAATARESVNLYSPPIDDETAAKAWCERWAAAVLREIALGARGGE